MSPDGRAFNRALGKEMRAVREQRGWTLQDVANRIPDGHWRTVRTWEVGERDVPLSRLSAWCAALHIDLAVVVTRAQERLEAEQRVLGIVTDNLRVVVALRAYVGQQRWGKQNAERAAYERLLERFGET